MVAFPIISKTIILYTSFVPERVCDCFIYLSIFTTKLLDLFCAIIHLFTIFLVLSKITSFLTFSCSRRDTQIFSVKNINSSLRSPNCFLWFLWLQHIGGTLLDHLGWVQDLGSPRCGSAQKPTRMASNMNDMNSSWWFQPI